ncbi:hypothetical protein [Pseudoalteromonas sp. Z9A4]|uniref:hypothetical protein n=1 Tax=Pseudoalteromonas sp. Z9A4 TaxID=2686353 RepID=UPI00140B9AE0|nr:hypothetical protein [Pseudoalteromonas sp. Z9A4]
MQDNILFICLGVSWLLLVISIVFTLFSRFKHTKFKQHLFRFLNLVFIVQVLVGTLFAVSVPDNTGNISRSYWILLAIQVLCILFCYISVKRRTARIRPSLEFFSMD